MHGRRWLEGLQIGILISRFLYLMAISNSDESTSYRIRFTPRVAGTKDLDGAVQL
jgi:hypothetical protein